jgi:miniconductance mechanosensitive channel
MRSSINNILQNWGMGDGAELLSSFILIVFILILCLIVNLIAKRIVLRLVHRLTEASATEIDDLFVKRKVFTRLSHLAPAIVIYASASLPFPDSPQISLFIGRVASAYMLFVGVFVIDAILNACHDIYQRLNISKKISIKSYLQVVKIFLFVFFAILILATLLDKSPWVFLSGLGAMTAVLMLVFKDSILGFVASIQLSANDMVQPGDWIEMRSHGADGDVIDVSITSVKVQNWDKTISTIPTYALVSNEFKNWRGMSESGGRRIKRSLNIDMNSVSFCDQAMRERFEKFQFLAPYIKERQEEIDRYNASQSVDTSQRINGRRMTNIGCFRAYLKGYLKNHPKIHQDMTLLVRQLAPGKEGLPIEIYVFSNDQVWANYEDIQADIFDHILAVLPEFNLNIFQSPSGRDFRKFATS